MTSQQLAAWLEDRLPTLERLASLDFDQSSHERFFIDAGWQLVRESWYPDTCFEIRFADVQRRLVALYDDGQQEIGIGLFALGNPRESHEYTLGSVAAYHEGFKCFLDSMRPLLSQDHQTGNYRYPDHDIVYNYATWGYQSATVILVQHHEGDGHLAHQASLDIRIRPGGSIEFPLVTNMLF